MATMDHRSVRSEAPTAPFYREDDVVQVSLSVDPTNKHSFHALGLVRYIGNLKGMQRSQSVNDNLAHYVGIELLQPVDSLRAHNGTFNGYRYFECSEQHGILIPISCVVRRLSPRHLFEELRRIITPPATHPLLNADSSSFMRPIREMDMELVLNTNHTTDFTEFSTISSRTPSAMRNANIQTPSFTPQTQTQFQYGPVESRTQTPHQQGFVYASDYDEAVSYSQHPQHTQHPQQPKLKSKRSRSKSRPGKKRAKRKETPSRPQRVSSAPYIDGPDTPSLSQVTNDGVLSQDPYGQAVANMTVNENEESAPATTPLDALAVYGRIDAGPIDGRIDGGLVDGVRMEMIDDEPPQTAHAQYGPNAYRQTQPVPRMDQYASNHSPMPQRSPQFRSNSKSLPPRRPQQGQQGLSRSPRQYPLSRSARVSRVSRVSVSHSMALQGQPLQRHASHGYPNPAHAQQMPQGPSVPAMTPHRSYDVHSTRGAGRAANPRHSEKKRPKTIGTVTFAPRNSLTQL